MPLSIFPLSALCEVCFADRVDLPLWLDCYSYLSKRVAEKSFRLYLKRAFATFKYSQKKMPII